MERFCADSRRIPIVIYTAAVAILDLVLFLADHRLGKGALFIAPCAVLGKLYSNSMMVLLNSRMGIDGGRNAVDSMMMMGAHDEVILDSRIFRMTGMGSGTMRTAGRVVPVVVPAGEQDDESNNQVANELKSCDGTLSITAVIRTNV